MILNNKDVPNNSCERLAPIFSLVGDKWTIIVVLFLASGSKRFNQIETATAGVSQRMLTRTLRSLERYGLVLRKIHPTMPPKVEYSLTPLGVSLCEPIDALGEWTSAHIDEIEAAQKAYKKS